MASRVLLRRDPCYERSAQRSSVTTFVTIAVSALAAIAGVSVHSALAQTPPPRR